MQEVGSGELMAGGIDWFRWHHGSVNDPKFRLVARRACVRVGDVITMWALLLEQASAAVPRGHPGNIDFETIEMDLDLPEGAALAIYTAMVDRKLIDGGTGAIASWERRQPKRERDPAPASPDAPQPKSSTERSRECRARKAGGDPCNAMQRHATPEDGGAAPSSASSSPAAPREEESREEGVDTSLRSVSPPSPPQEAAPPAPAPAPARPAGKRKGKHAYTAEFEEAWAAYPARPGNSKADAFKAWNARIAEGKTPAAMLAGVQAYAAYCAGTDKVGSEFVKQGATFFGPGLHFEAAWPLPKPVPVRPPIQGPTPMGPGGALITTRSDAAEITARELAAAAARPFAKPSPEQRKALLRVRQQAARKAPV
jgi:hypothetical protein